MTNTAIDPFGGHLELHAGWWEIGGNDEIHGELGDDFVYIGGGNDVVYGDADDDDLIGGWGNDWISGGTGQDGILGDDGRIFTSRNSSTGWTAQDWRAPAQAGTCFSEPLYGITAFQPGDTCARTSRSRGDVLDEFIYTPARCRPR